MKAIVLGVVLLASVHAGSFTGPVSPYFLQSYVTSTTGDIYEVQGTSIINQFSAEGNLLALAGGNINTRSDYPIFGDGAQYTLDGTPTGVTDPPSLPAGQFSERAFDGTSDGTYNYYVQLFGATGGDPVHGVYRTSLDWSNPELLFSLNALLYSAAYDPANQSLWIGSSSSISDYALDGTLLSSFSISAIPFALAYDPADGTLWLHMNGSLVQYSTSGTLLQQGAIDGLPATAFAGEILNAADPPVPEPGTLSLMAGCLCTAAIARSRRRLIGRRLPPPASPLSTSAA